MSPGNKERPLPAKVISLALLVIVGFGSRPMTAQTSPGRPAFEVASVRPNKSEDFRNSGMQYLPGGRFSATNIPLFMLIGEAWHIPVFNESVRLSGSPDWIRAEKFDITATPAPESVPGGLTSQAQRARTRLMLQTLLADRFKLVVRRETRELPVYAVGIGRNGSKLTKAKIEEKDCPESKVPCHQFAGGQGRGIHATAVDMSDLVVFLENFADHPVVDQTGLTGLYEIDTQGWIPLIGRAGPVAQTAESQAMSDPARPTLYNILDKLGLKMESKKAPVDIYVIERVQRPTEN